MDVASPLRAAALAALALLAGALAGAADEVFLKDGSELTGEVLAVGERVVRIAVRRDDGRVVVEVPREDVQWIRRLTDADERLERAAEEALLAGDHAGAVAALGDLVAARPEDGRARRELGFALVLANRDERAAGVLAEACRLDPTDFEAHLLRAQVLERLGRRDAAIAAFEAAAFKGPRHAVAWRSWARLLVERGAPGDLEDALRALTLGGREAPADEAIAVERALLLLRMAEGEEAAREARRVLAAFCERAPHALEAVRLLAAIEADLGEPESAKRRIARLLLRVDPDHPARERLEADLARYAWMTLGRPGLAPPGLDAADPDLDPARAARLLDLLLGDSPDSGRLLLARARVALRRGRLDAAGAWLEQAALAGPRAVAGDALLLQEVVAALAGADAEPSGPPSLLGPEASVAKARRLVALAGWLPAAHATLARALARSGAYEEAAAAYDAAAERTADDAGRERLAAAAASAREEAERRARNEGL